MWKVKKTQRTPTTLGQVHFSLPLKSHNTLILSYSSIPVHINIGAISDCLSTVREYTLTEFSFFFYKACYPTKAEKLFSVKYICYRCYTLMLLSGNNQKLMSINSHSSHHDTYTHQIFSSPSRGHNLPHSRSRHTDSVCFSCLMKLSVPRAQSEYCGQSQSINDLRLAF